MKRVTLPLKSVDLKKFRGGFASDKHCQHEITEPTIVYVDGMPDVPVAVYARLPERLPHVVAALKRINYGRHSRTAGMLTQSKTFGYAPKLEVRQQETCHVAGLAKEDPAAHLTITSLTRYVERIYQSANPKLYQQHTDTVQKVLPEWRLNDGVFTSGIINQNNRLPYHFDAGNFANCWSNMLVFKRHCTGGDLACPELDTVFRLDDHSVLLFDGQSILHGVTPFRLTRSDGHRYTIVYYSLQQMWRCDPQVDGVRLAQKRRTERERKKIEDLERDAAAATQEYRLAGTREEKGRKK